MTEEGPVRVRGDAFFVRAPGGATVYHQTGSFSVSHDRAYELLTALTRRLDGTRSATEVLAALPSQARPAVEGLLASLLRHGFLLPAGPSAGPRPAWVTERFGEHLDYLGQFPGDPYQRFTTLRAARVAVVGSGPLLRAAAGALADHAFAHVTIVGGDIDAVGPVLEAVSRRDPEARWTVGTDAGDATVVVYAGLVPDDPSAELVAVLYADAQRLAGAVRGTGEDWCTRCLTRVLGAEDATAAARTPAPAASLLAFQVVHRIHAELAGPPGSRDRTVVTVDPDTLTAARHPLWRHPDCSRHPRPAAVFTARREDDESPVRPDVASRESAPNAEAARITAAVRSWTDPVTGPLLTVGEDDLPQLPLAVSRCGTTRATVTRTGPWAREARTQAVLAALATEGARLLRARGTAGHVGAGWSLPEARYRALVALSAELPAGPTGAWTPVDGGRTPLTGFLLGLLDGRRVEVATAPLVTGLWQATVRADRRAIGSGVGVSASHAEDNALLAAAAGGVDPVHLAPPVKTWAEALRTARSGASLDTVEWNLTAELAFVGEAAAVVAVRTVGDQP
ncbi:hypothetical protein [Micromonospora sp. KC207]|uniref:hypothetical protein n=1 Tax=Micromonospora sp. KC207 TaxID=2530377 RepID=UPI0014047F4F|nr:hypothetical protein [Micromonospora sp. KC207]